MDTTALLAIALIFLISFGVIWRRGHLSLQWVPTIFVLSIILCPLLPASNFDLRIRPDEVGLAIVLFSWFAVSVANRRSLNLFAAPAAKWFGLFGLCMLVSTTYAGTRFGTPPSGRDFLEFAKLLEYFLLFAAMATIKLDGIAFKRVIVAAMAAYACSAMLGFAQYFDIANVNASISPVYASGHNLGAMLEYSRVTGTTGNPNVFGATMVIASCLTLALALFGKTPTLRVFAWIGLGMFIGALSLAQSRTAAIALCVGFIVTLTLSFRQRFIGRVALSAMVIVVLIAAIGGIVLSSATLHEQNRYRELKDPASAGTFKERLAMWEPNIRLWEQSPILGYGPAKLTMDRIVDNEWVLLLRRYGVLGMTAFILLFWRINQALKKLRLQTRADTLLIAVTIALQAIIISMAVYMLAATVYNDSFQLMPILMVLSGVACSQQHVTSKKMAVTSAHVWSDFQYRTELGTHS
ncbi:MAG: hypothetical protein JWO13_1773 [Acidobacteriales bacterium]|nr:hypothetical protein [Terriglobales bacterium]